MYQRKNTVDCAVEIFGQKEMAFMPETFLYDFPPSIIVIQIRSVVIIYKIVDYNVVAGVSQPY